MSQIFCRGCGERNCACLEAECRACNGTGRVQNGGYPLIGQRDYGCADCGATGWIRCNRAGTLCPFPHCYCEAAWEREQEDNASEPPPTADELHQRAHDERQALRSGRPL